MQTQTPNKYQQKSNIPKTFGTSTQLTTISDRKQEVEDGSRGTIAYYTADASAEQSRSIISSSDYYPFGFAMDGRDYESNNYRFGFNGKENLNNFFEEINEDTGEGDFTPNPNGFNPQYNTFYH